MYHEIRNIIFYNYLYTQRQPPIITSKWWLPITEHLVLSKWVQPKILCPETNIVWCSLLKKVSSIYFNAPLKIWPCPLPLNMSLDMTISAFQYTCTKFNKVLLLSIICFVFLKYKMFKMRITNTSFSLKMCLPDILLKRLN